MEGKAEVDQQTVDSSERVSQSESRTKGFMARLTKLIEGLGAGHGLPFLGGEGMGQAREKINQHPQDAAPNLKKSDK